MVKIDVVMFKNAIHPTAYERIPFLYHGINTIDSCRYSEEEYESCDVAFYNGAPKKREEHIIHNLSWYRKRLIEIYHPENRLVMESPVFRKNRRGTWKDWYFRLGWNGYQYDSGNFNNNSCPNDRWLHIKKHQNIEIKDWRENTGNHILLCLQKENDSSLKELDAIQWAKDIVKTIQKHSDRSVIIRPHPLSPDYYPKIKNTKISIGKDIYEDFKDAWATISYNSLSSIESVCEGISTFTMDKGSMAWPVSHHDLSSIEKPKIFDRDQWLNNLAYTQWNLSEMGDGTAWRHVRPVYFS